MCPNLNQILIFFRIIMSLVVTLFIFYLDKFKNNDGTFKWFFFLTYFVVNGLEKIVGTTLFITMVAFFAKISDQNIGGINYKFKKEF